MGAREHPRGIWDALKRKEVYATTGDRPVVRVFAGWDFVPADLDRPDFAANGYAHGVPMGGDLSKAPAGKRPVFMVHALRDPDGPNLDRIQIIKGWLGKDGKTQERIFDVAVSGGRKIGPDGRCKTSVGSTVDVANATYTNTIGAATLSAYWKDPAFDATQRAFYYVRVIQIPSPRWTAYDQKRYGIKMADYVPMTVTDRAYTSPIWYTPAKFQWRTRRTEIALASPGFWSHEAHPSRTAGAFPPAGGRAFHRLQPDAQIRRERRAGKDRRHARPTRVHDGGLHPHPATGAHPEEWEGLIRHRVREEVYYREALALGLDKDDPIIRRRLQQKMEFVSDDSAAQAQPTDAELNAYLQAHPDKFRVEQRFTFRQVYLDPQKHGANLARDAAQLLAKLNQAGGDTRLCADGRSVHAGSQLHALPASEIARQFGEEFAAKLDRT